jgi:hypothetical protein
MGFAASVIGDYSKMPQRVAGPVLGMGSKISKPAPLRKL